MKIRIKGNSIRLRLTKSDVEKLVIEKHIEESTAFPSVILIYSLQCKLNITELSADFSDNKITVFIPEAFAENWALNDVVGIDTKITTAGNEQLYILVEKDFQCIENTNEDQSDNFDNPDKACGN